MSAPVLPTTLNPDSPEAQARAAHNRALAQDLRARVAQAALGGNEKSRERHTSRGKLLPRERVERDRKSTRLNSSHVVTSRMPSSA